MTWNILKANSDALVSLIDEELEKKWPQNIGDVLLAVERIDKGCKAMPNPNGEGQYCQLILYPTAKWETWSKTSMSISRFNLYK